MSTEASAILFVDDESTSRKWFVRAFGGEFDIVTAAGAEEALALLAQDTGKFAVLVTDYRMPERDGMKLLRAVQSDHRYLVRLLATAYAEKDVAIAAVNQGKVVRILEKPLEEEGTAEALREALALYRREALERAMNEGRVSALRETLGFLAHELNTPLATVRGCVASVVDRHMPQESAAVPGTVTFRENAPGEVLAALERAERRALYCQSLVSTFVQSARDAYPGAEPQAVSARSIVEALLDEYPFEMDERAAVTYSAIEDFSLLGRRDLLYLVLCTLAKNALLALRGRPEPRLHFELGLERGGRQRPWIRVVDNGPGVPQDILARLTREPVTTRGRSGGSGMGLMFCRRVMESMGGAIEVHSPPGEGATVVLYFRPLSSPRSH